MTNYKREQISNPRAGLPTLQISNPRAGLRQSR